ncbi:molybdate ABC transporter substrate-binding protein [Bauldia sp.]|uniref:molybdate ABC transporter substrate-binding protein n=1 Tax=Bauldia sp. TaxID=2575872 RepID=UPI003BAA0B6B
MTWSNTFARLAALSAGLLAAGTAAADPDEGPSAKAEPVVVFAAASLGNALDDVIAAYAEESDRMVRASYAGTPTLARQIEQLAPADLFVAADDDWMDYVAARDLIDIDSRRTLLGNQLALVAPDGFTPAIDLAPGLDLSPYLEPDHRLAIADTEAVPAGRYGRAALEFHGAWGGVADRLVQTDNVRSALAFVARGEVPLGVVYTTDAAAEPRVAVVGVFPQDSHPPIHYDVAVTAQSTNPNAEDFLAFLGSPAARSIFEAHGFAVVTGST